MSSEYNTNSDELDLTVLGAVYKGESVYEMAVRLGFIGTEEEFLESLVGPPSPSAEAATAANTAAQEAAIAAGLSADQAEAFAATIQASIDNAETIQAAVAAEGEAQVAAITAAIGTSVADVIAEGADQVTAVQSAGSTQVDLVNAAGTNHLAVLAAKETEALAAIAAAEGAELAPIIAEGEAQLESITTASTEGLNSISVAVEAGALALGMPIGGIVDVIPASSGYEEGWCFCDDNGWTAPAYYTHPTGVVGKVVRIKIPGADFSELAGAIRIYIPPPVLAADYTIVFWGSQSDGYGSDSLPMPERTPSAFAAMLDTARPPAWTGAFGTTFAPAVGVENITSTTHQGSTWPLATADALEQLITDRDGLTQVMHGRKVLFVQVGLGSADVPAFSYPSDHFTRVLDWCNAVKAAADLEGKTVKVGAILWAGWGAYAYQNGYTQATVESRIDSYCGSTGSIATHVLPIFGQTGEVIPVAIFGDNHHYQAADKITPQVALAEQALVTTQPNRYDFVQNKGIHHFNGRNLGWGASASHHHADEEELMAGLAADWLHRKLTPNGVPWVNVIPTAAEFTRPAADELLWTPTNLPTGVSFGFEPSGLTTTFGARPNHGWFLCDPSTPTVEVPLKIAPYEKTPGTLLFKGLGAIPSPVEIRFGCRSSGDSIAGNTVIKFDVPFTVPVRGVETPVFRTLPTTKIQVA